MLVLAAIALGLPTVLALAALGAVHGSNVRPASVALMYIAFFVLLPIAAMTFIVGMKRLFFAGGPAGSTTMAEYLKENE